MKGLPFKATVGDIVEFFDGLKVVSSGVHIIKQPDNRATGMAFVEFISPEEAEKAMAKDHGTFGAKYGDRFVTLQVVSRAEVDTTLHPDPQQTSLAAGVTPEVSAAVAAAAAIGQQQ
eukprot:gene29724-37054_t